MVLSAKRHIERTYRGAQEAANLLDTLKHLKGSKKLRVIEVLRLVQRAESLASRTDAPNGKRNHEAPETKDLEAIIEVHGLLDCLLSRCSVRPVVWNWEKGKL